MHIYVRGVTEKGSIWLEDPVPWFDGRLMLMFDKAGVNAGVLSKKPKGPLLKRLTDELDHAGIHWSNLRLPRIGVLTVDGKDHTFFLARIDLIGPLPKVVADGIVCASRRKSLGLRQSIRYGG